MHLASHSATADAFTSQSEQRQGRALHYRLSQSFGGIIITHQSISAPGGFPHQPGASLGSVRIQRDAYKLYMYVPSCDNLERQQLDFEKGHGVAKRLSFLFTLVCGPFEPAGGSHSHSATGDAFTRQSELRELHRYEPGDAFTSQSEQRQGRALHYRLSQSFGGIIITHLSISAPFGFPHQPGASLGSVRIQRHA